jgi:hypothetical protein
VHYFGRVDWEFLLIRKSVGGIGWKNGNFGL